MSEEEKGSEKKKLNSVIDRFLDIFFSKDKTKLYVLLLFILAFILRIIGAKRFGLSADDANHAVRPVGIFASGKMVIWDQSSALWYYIQAVFYRIVGATQLGSRAAPALFGALFVVLMYLFVKQIFKSKKIALIASFFTAVSPFLIKNTLPEMDVAVMFFVIFSSLYILKFGESYKKSHLFIASILIGIAILIKIYALFFVFSYFLYLIYIYRKDKGGNRKPAKNILLFLIIIFIFCVPTLTHNYLLYKDKGYMDLIFTNFLKLGVDKAEKFYGWGAGWMPYTDFKGFFFGNQKNFEGWEGGLYKLPGFIIILYFVFENDPTLLVFGVLGFFLLLSRKKFRYIGFFLLMLLPALIYLGANIPMSKHFVFVPCLFIPMSAYFLNDLHNKTKKIKLRYLLLIIFIISLLMLGRGWGSLRSHFYDKSADSQIIEYKKEIPANSLVVVDSRVYRGFITWMFHDRYYIESGLFSSALEESKKYGSATALDVYFIECVKDDCGWGTISSQPEFNQSMEEIVSWFRNNSKIEKEMSQVNRNKYYFPMIIKREEEMGYRVYHATLMINPAILPIAKSTHNWFMYPVGYDESIGEIFDDYTVYSLPDKLLDKTARFIFYTSIILSFLAIILLFYLLTIDEDEKGH